MAEINKNMKKIIVFAIIALVAACSPQPKNTDLAKLHAKREQDLVAEIKYIDKKLKEAKNKQAEYSAKNITLLIKKVSAKEILINEQFAIQSEKTLLTSQFSEISQKYDALIAQIKNQHQEFNNEKIAESNLFRAYPAGRSAGGKGLQCPFADGWPYARRYLCRDRI